MIPLEHSVRPSFKKIFSNKKGSIFIEASIVMPLACIIAVAMIQIAIISFNELAKQVADHKLELSERSYVLQTEIIRNYERFS